MSVEFFGLELLPFVSGCFFFTNVERSTYYIPPGAESRDQLLICGIRAGSVDHGSNLIITCELLVKLAKNDIYVSNHATALFSMQHTSRTIT